MASSSVILVHSEHLLMKVLTHTGLSLYLLNDGPIRAETCRRKYDPTQKGILTNMYILLKINSKVKYTQDAKYEDCVCISLMHSICAAPLIFKVLKVNAYKNNVGIASSFPPLIPTFVLAPA